ncbi:MAG: Ig-like domain-containing protein [Bacteroidota bacterium]
MKTLLTTLSGILFICQLSAQTLPEMDCSNLMDNLLIQNETDIGSDRRAVQEVRTEGTVSINSPTEFLLFEAQASIILTAGFEVAAGNLFHARIATCAAVADPCGGLPNWDENTVYVGGDEVQLNGKKYLANFWTQGDNPETNNAPFGQPWILQGDCTDDFNQSPTVTITAPVDGTTIDENTSLTIAADASDTDGTVTQVEFFVDNMSIGVDTDAPYLVIWTADAIGTKEVKARATDNEGATGTSAVIQVSVTGEGGNSCDGIPAWEANTTYLGGQLVQLNGIKYEANFWTRGDNPETNNAPFGQPWILIGNCDDTPPNASPTVSITSPLEGAMFLIDDPIPITADAADTDGTITQVEFFVDNQSLGVDTQSPYEVTWNNATFGSHSLTAIATDDMGATTTSASVNIEVTDGNERPVVDITSPNEGDAFMTNAIINITATASDTDGTVTQVEFFVDGTKIGEDLAAPYETIWSSATNGSYELTAVATDDQGGMTTSASVSTFVTEDGNPPTLDIPKHILVGYWHNFNNGSTAPPLGQVTTDWDVVDIAFAIPVSPGSATMNFTPDPSITSDAQFRQDVQLLQSRGQKVLISIGGATGAIELLSSVDAQEFATSMIDIIEDYGFDGLDIDLEGSSLSLESGDNDFTNPTSPKIVFFIEGMNLVLDHFDESFVLSAAPETAFVQGGRGTYAGLFGAYLPVLYDLREELDFIHVQHYNSGCMLGLDGVCYAQGTADFHVAMAEMLLQGFPVAGHAINFPAFRQDQVAFGIPSSPQAAGGGYTIPADVVKALDYIIKGISFGGNYTLVQSAGYPDFRGLMTWSINWDLFNNDEFVLNYRPYFDQLNSPMENRSAQVLPEIAKDNLSLSIFPNPAAGLSHIQIQLAESSDVQLVIYNESGSIIQQLTYSDLPKGGYLFPVDFEAGLYTVRVASRKQTRVERLVLIR